MLLTDNARNKPTNSRRYRELPDSGGQCDNTFCVGCLPHIDPVDIEAILPVFTLGYQ